jgi:hypothetical protein
MASFLLRLEGKAIIARAKGKSIMPEFVVAIDHIIYYAVRAEDEITALDVVLKGQQERAMDAPLNADESIAEERHGIPPLRHGSQSLHGLAESLERFSLGCRAAVYTKRQPAKENSRLIPYICSGTALGLDAEQTRNVLQRLHRKVGSVSPFIKNDDLQSARQAYGEACACS